MIVYRKISESSDCPFYTVDAKNQKQCFVKYTNTLNIMNAIVEGPVSIAKSDWQSDCGGDWANCCFVPLLYDTTSAENESSESNMKYTDKEIEDYSPFEEEEDNEIDEEVNEPEEEPEPSVLVRIHKVVNPYLVKADVLVYPTNRTLLIDDPELNRMSRFTIQEECDAYTQRIDIQMGMVYPTSNGGDIAGGVVAKKIYHAVVAGESRLVSSNINNAVTQSLLMAEKQGCKVVLMTPFDCGMVDVGETARIQLTAIHNFINKTAVKNIERIYIVMTDDESVEIFKEYFDRIF